MGVLIDECALTIYGCWYFVRTTVYKIVIDLLSGHITVELHVVQLNTILLHKKSENVNDYKEWCEFSSSKLRKSGERT